MLVFPPARTAIVSWNTTAACGEIAVAARDAAGGRTRALRLAAWSPAERRSFSETDGAVVVVETLHAERPIVALDVACDVPLARLFVATRAWEADGRPDHAGEAAPGPTELAVPPLSQYGHARADAPRALRGKADALCSPTALAMLLQFRGLRAEVAATAAAVYDAAFDGTGNWAFNVAHAAARGLVGCVAYLRDLGSAERLLAAGVPLALSLAWESGTLPGAPLPRSAGHLVVLRGFSANGDALVHDPAHPAVRTSYPRAAFARAWLGHGGIAYVLAHDARPLALLA